MKLLPVFDAHKYRMVTGCSTTDALFSDSSIKWADVFSSGPLDASYSRNQSVGLPQAFAYIPNRIALHPLIEVELGERVDVLAYRIADGDDLAEQAGIYICLLASQDVVVRTPMAGNIRSSGSLPWGGNEQRKSSASSNTMVPVVPEVCDDVDQVSPEKWLASLPRVTLCCLTPRVFPRG